MEKRVQTGYQHTRTRGNKLTNTVVPQARDEGREGRDNGYELYISVKHKVKRNCWHEFPLRLRARSGAAAGVEAVVPWVSVSPRQVLPQVAARCR